MNCNYQCLVDKSTWIHFLVVTSCVIKASVCDGDVWGRVALCCVTLFGAVDAVVLFICRSTRFLAPVCDWSLIYSDNYR